jgi:hypothetical protein
MRTGVVKYMYLLAFCAISSIGCAGNEEPARHAVAAAESSLNAIRKDGAAFAPDALRIAEADLAALKGEIDRGRFDEVLAASHKFDETVDLVKQAIAARQLQMPVARREFEQLQRELPALVEKIDKRIAELSARKTAGKTSASSLEVAKFRLESLKARWAKTTALFAAGNAIDALERGQELREEALRVDAQLGAGPA